MEDTPGKHADRYDVSGNVEAQYVDPNCTVLVNKLGVSDLATLQIREEEVLARAYEVLLGEVRVDTSMTCELIRHIHRRVFGDLYSWAGRWRTVWIGKPGITWGAPDFLHQNMEAFEKDVLDKYPARSLCDDDAFCAAVGELQGEFLLIHPFREGNARTVKLLSDLLAAQTQRPPLVYDQIDAGKQRYIAAAMAAFKKDYAPMTAVIRTALEAARR